MPAVAITDTGNLFGALEFADRLRARPACSRSSAASSALAPRRRRRRPARPRPRRRPDRLVLLAQSEAGYRNLLQLVSRAFLEGEPAATPQRRAGATSTAAREGLIALTGGPAGPVGRLLAEGQARPAEALLDALDAAVSRPALYRADAPRPRRRARASSRG